MPELLVAEVLWPRPHFEQGKKSLKKAPRASMKFFQLFFQGDASHAVRSARAVGESRASQPRAPR